MTRRRGAPVLAVMTRQPVPGSAKTRLIPTLGAEGAADLQRQMTAHTLRQARLLRAASGSRAVVWFDGGSARGMRAVFGGGLLYRRQGGGDLGVRMRNAAASALAEGADRVVVVGCDCPGLDTVRMREAFDALDEAPFVLGPAVDGGYYLIGVRGGVSPSTLSAAFGDIPWGTDAVFERTVAALDRAGIKPALLPVLSDIDEPRDLGVWEQAERAPQTLSVVITALDDSSTISAAVASASVAGVEVIVADGGSSDRTADIAASTGVRVIEAPRGRASQLNAGARVASGDALLFLHADTVLPRGFAPEALEILADPDVTVGAFMFATDLHTPTMRRFERGTNWRARRLGAPYGDQALFTRAATFRALGGFPDLPVMEDYEFVRRARACGRVRVADASAVTSGRAWWAYGPWRWMLANRLSVLAYRMGVDAATIAGLRARLRRKTYSKR